MHTSSIRALRVIKLSPSIPDIYEPDSNACFVFQTVHFVCQGSLLKFLLNWTRYPTGLGKTPVHRPLMVGSDVEGEGGHSIIL